ncbi:MAG: hypothetical protein AAGD22_03725 [Verrucomicrobiota bacterium]
MMENDTSREGGASPDGGGYTLDEIFGDGGAGSGGVPLRSKFLCLLGFGGGAVHDFVQLNLGGGPWAEVGMEEQGEAAEGGGVGILELEMEGEAWPEVIPGEMGLIDLTGGEGVVGEAEELFLEDGLERSMEGEDVGCEESSLVGEVTGETDDGREDRSGDVETEDEWEMEALEDGEDEEETEEVDGDGDDAGVDAVVSRTVWEQLEAIEAEREQRTEMSEGDGDGVQSKAEEVEKIEEMEEEEEAKEANRVEEVEVPVSPPDGEREASGLSGDGCSNLGEREEDGMAVSESGESPAVLPDDELIPVSRVRRTEDGRLLAACPVCMHFLNVNEGMIGVSGACPECQAGIVAVEREVEGGETELVIETLRPVKESSEMGSDGRPIVPMTNRPSGAALSSEEDLEPEDGVLWEGDQGEASGRMGSGKWALPPGLEDEDDLSAGIVPARPGGVDPVDFGGKVEDEAGEPLVFGVRPQRRVGDDGVEDGAKGEEPGRATGGGEVEADGEATGKAGDEQRDETAGEAELLEGGGAQGGDGAMETGHEREVLDRQEGADADGDAGEFSQGDGSPSKGNQMAKILELTPAEKPRRPPARPRVLILFSVFLGCVGVWWLSSRPPVAEWVESLRASLERGKGDESVVDGDVSAGEMVDEPGGHAEGSVAVPGAEVAKLVDGAALVKSLEAGQAVNEFEDAASAVPERVAVVDEGQEVGRGGLVDAAEMPGGEVEAEEGREKKAELEETAGSSEAENAELDLSNLTEKEKVLALSKRVMERFLDADGWEERQEYVLGVEQAGSSLEAFYQDHDERSFRGLVTVGDAMLDEETGLWVAAMHIWETGKPTYVLSYVIGNEERGFKVDWDWYRQINTQPLQALFTRPMSEARELRVMMRRSSFLGTVPEGEEEPLAVTLASPFKNPFSGTIYMAPEATDTATMREALPWGESRMATVRLGWVRDGRYGDAPRVVMEDILGWGLAIESKYAAQR